MKKLLKRIRFWLRRYLLWQFWLNISSGESPYHAFETHLDVTFGFWDHWQPMAGWNVWIKKRGFIVESHSFKLILGKEETENRKWTSEI